MIIFVSELNAGNDVSEHGSAKDQISRHQDLFDQYFVFRTENHASSEEKKPYNYRQEKENSFDHFK